MAEVIRMPRMSDTMEEGNIVGWLKQEGDKVEPGETLAEVETDKATMELDSYTEGVLLHIAVKSGTVPIDGVIAVIGQPGEDWQSLLSAPAAAAAPVTAAAPAAAPAEVVATAAPAPAASPAAMATESRTKASPLAKSVAREAGVDISQITGTGDNGRIVKRDVEAFLETKPAPATAATEAVSPQPAMTSAVDQYEDLPLSQMRKTIARRLSESKFSAPHFYLTMEIDMANASDWRRRINEVAPVKVSFNDLVIKAAAAALRQHPMINASWLGDRIRMNHEVNIGVAVAVDEGLLVPVIKNADAKSLSQINTEVKAYAAKAKDKKLQPQEMQGNTFTISNLGMFGIDEFTAIINPPDACILAVGAIVEKPVVRGGQLEVGQVMKVTLSCDHRVVDGAKGAQFLQSLKGILENPILLLV
jgi:pyruvate dehydrogenase E2 component (dihydrolipoamide acetyltransferase)